MYEFTYCLLELILEGEGSIMKSDTLKTIITLIILFVLIVVAIKFAVKVLFPIAVIIVAAYIVYMVISRNRH